MTPWQRKRPPDALRATTSPAATLSSTSSEPIPAHGWGCALLSTLQAARSLGQSRLSQVASGKGMNEQTVWDIVKALITAGAGFGGVYYGQRNLARKDAKQAERDARQADQDRAYVASVVIEHLERYINGCVAVAQDDGTEYGQPAGENGYYRTTTTPPDFDPHKIDVNWRILPPDLIYDIFAIRSRRESIDGYLDNPGFDDPPDYSEFFWWRGFLYAQLGQRVSEIALRLRKAGGIPSEVLNPGDWSRDEAFAEVIEKYNANRALYEEERRKSLAKLIPPQ